MTPRRPLPPDDVLESLPDPYARALVLLTQGVDEDEISARLEVPREAVVALIELAWRKADRAAADRAHEGYR